MGKTKKRAGFFLPLEPRWNTKYQKFVKSKDIRKLPSKKYPQHNQKSCCIWSALKEKQPALFFPGVWQVCSFPTAACCCRVYFFSPMAAKGWAHPESRCPVPGADVLVLGKQRCWHCPCQPTSLRAPSPIRTTAQTHPASPRILCLCRNAGEQPRRDGFITYSWAILTNLTTEEGGEWNVWADCCKLPGSGYKLKKLSEIKREA